MSEDQKNLDENHEHDFDGIKELDNKAPIWIILLFLVTIGFSLIYVVIYFGYPKNGKDQASEYDSSVVQFKKDLEVLQKSSSTQQSTMSIAQKIEKGGSLFLSKGCIACHGSLGEGNNIGPNLTDNSWINGCKFEDITKIITEGNPAKGMTAFKTSMAPDEIEMIATFIQQKLKNSNPANAKAPQGIECK